MDVSQLPVYRELGISVSEFRRSNLLARHFAPKLGEEVAMAGDRAEIPPDFPLVVYRVSEFPILARLDPAALAAVHAVKAEFGGRLIEPGELDRPKEVRGEVVPAWSVRYLDRVQLRPDGTAPRFCTRLFEAARERAFPTLKVACYTLHGERGWEFLCGHHGTGEALQRAAWDELEAFDLEQKLFG